jgi:hypothetical protein
MLSGASFVICRKLAGKMAGASIMSVANFVPTALKGMTVDIPLAMTWTTSSLRKLYYW